MLYSKPAMDKWELLLCLHKLLYVDIYYKSQAKVKEDIDYNWIH